KLHDSRGSKAPNENSKTFIPTPSGIWKPRIGTSHPARWHDRISPPHPRGGPGDDATLHRSVVASIQTSSILFRNRASGRHHCGALRFFKPVQTNHHYGHEDHRWTATHHRQWLLLGEDHRRGRGGYGSR